MADAAVPDTETVLEFVNRHYAGLKRDAETDNNPENENITRVIGLIDGLFDTINKDDATHDTIVDQLKALRTNYKDLGPLLGDDIISYARYLDANDSLNMIVDGLEEVEAGVGVGGEHEPAPAPGSTASGPVVSPASESALVPVSRELVPASTA